MGGPEVLDWNRLNEFLSSFYRHGSVKIKSLTIVTVHGFQNLGLFLCLNTFCDDYKTKPVSHIYDRFQNLNSFSFILCIDLHELHI